MMIQPLPGDSCLLMEVRMWMRVTLMRMMKRKRFAAIMGSVGVMVFEIGWQEKKQEHLGSRSENRVLELQLEYIYYMYVYRVIKLYLYNVHTASPITRIDVVGWKQELPGPRSIRAGTFTPLQLYSCALVHTVHCTVCSH